MNSIEQMRWAKDLISEKTNGLQELVVGNVHDDLYIRTSDKATVGLYLSVLPNKKRIGTIVYLKHIPELAEATTADFYQRNEIERRTTNNRPTDGDIRRKCV